MMVTECVVVLGHGPKSPELDKHCRIRLSRALAAVCDFLQMGKKVVLILPTGSHLDAGETMATQMYDHLIQIGGEWLMKPEIQVIINRTERRVWSTRLEMQYAQRVTERLEGEVHYHFVTNEVHAIRVICTNDLIGLPNCLLILSNDDPPPRFHEALAYIKLHLQKFAPFEYLSTAIENRRRGAQKYVRG